jgi:hypothetical protein
MGFNKPYGGRRSLYTIWRRAFGKTWEAAKGARQRARLARQGAAYQGSAPRAAAPEIKALSDHQFDRALRWFRSNWGALKRPPNHLSQKMLAQREHLQDEIKALEDAIKAVRARRRKKPAKKKPRQSAAGLARAERQKLNGTAKRQAVIAKMTGHERNRWARAGYPADEKTFSAFAAAAIERMSERKAA